MAEDPKPTSLGQYGTPAAAVLALAAALGNYFIDLSGDTKDRIAALEREVIVLRYECDCGSVPGE